MEEGVPNQSEIHQHGFVTTPEKEQQSSPQTSNNRPVKVLSIPLSESSVQQPTSTLSTKAQGKKSSRRPSLSKYIRQQSNKFKKIYTNRLNSSKQDVRGPNGVVSSTPNLQAGKRVYGYTSRLGVISQYETQDNNYSSRIDQPQLDSLAAYGAQLVGPSMLATEQTLHKDSQQLEREFVVVKQSDIGSSNMRDNWFEGESEVSAYMPSIDGTEHSGTDNSKAKVVDSIDQVGVEIPKTPSMQNSPVLAGSENSLTHCTRATNSNGQSQQQHTNMDLVDTFNSLQVTAEKKVADSSNMLNSDGNSSKLDRIKAEKQLAALNVNNVGRQQNMLQHYSQLQTPFQSSQNSGRHGRYMTAQAELQFSDRTLLYDDTSIQRAASCPVRTPQGYTGAVVNPNDSAALHKAAFYPDLHTLQLCIRAATQDQLCKLDPKGQSPLHLAALRGNVQAVQMLLNAGVQADISNARGWAPLDEAVTAQRQDAAACLLLAHVDWVKQKMMEGKRQLVNALQDVPNLSMQLKWELGSPLVGFLLRRYAPCDTYTLWKKDEYVRLDGTLIGASLAEKSLLPEWKRGRYSLLFTAQYSGGSGKVYLVNHDKQEYFEVKQNELKETFGMHDVTDADRDARTAAVCHWDPTVPYRKVKVKKTDFSFQPLKTILGYCQTEKISGWNTVVYGAQGRLIAVTKIKSKTLPLTDRYEQYLQQVLEDDIVKEVGIDPYAFGIKKNKKDQSQHGEGPSNRQSSEGRKLTGKCWMAKDFPITLKQLLPLLDIMTVGNKYIGKVRDFLSKYSDQEEFPVKLQVPIIMTVYLSLLVQEFKLMTDNSAPPDSFFQIPAGYKKRSLAAAVNQKMKSLDSWASSQEIEGTFSDEKLSQLDDDSQQSTLMAQSQPQSPTLSQRSALMAKELSDNAAVLSPTADSQALNIGGQWPDLDLQSGDLRQLQQQLSERGSYLLSQPSKRSWSGSMVSALESQCLESVDNEDEFFDVSEWQDWGGDTESVMMLLEFNENNRSEQSLLSEQLAVLHDDQGVYTGTTTNQQKQALSISCQAVAQFGVQKQMYEQSAESAVLVEGIDSLRQTSMSSVSAVSASPVSGSDSFQSVEDIGLDIAFDHSKATVNKYNSSVVASLHNNVVQQTNSQQSLTIKEQVKPSTLSPTIVRHSDTVHQHHHHHHHHYHYAFNPTASPDTGSGMAINVEHAWKYAAPPSIDSSQHTSRSIQHVHDSSFSGVGNLAMGMLGNSPESPQTSTPTASAPTQGFQSSPTYQINTLSEHPTYYSTYDGVKRVNQQHAIGKGPFGIVSNERGQDSKHIEQGWSMLMGQQATTAAAPSAAEGKNKDRAVNMVNEQSSSMDHSVMYSTNRRETDCNQPKSGSSSQLHSRLSTPDSVANQAGVDVKLQGLSKKYQALDAEQVTSDANTPAGHDATSDCGSDISHQSSTFLAALGNLAKHLDNDNGTSGEKAKYVKYHVLDDSPGIVGKIQGTLSTYPSETSSPAMGYVPGPSYQGFDSAKASRNKLDLSILNERSGSEYDKQHQEVSTDTNDLAEVIHYDTMLEQKTRLSSQTIYEVSQTEEEVLQLEGSESYQVKEGIGTEGSALSSSNILQPFASNSGTMSEQAIDTQPPALEMAQKQLGVAERNVHQDASNGQDVVSIKQGQPGNGQSVINSVQLAASKQSFDGAPADGIERQTLCIPLQEHGEQENYQTKGTADYGTNGQAYNVQQSSQTQERGTSDEEVSIGVEVDKTVDCGGKQGEMPHELASNHSATTITTISHSEKQVPSNNAQVTSGSPANCKSGGAVEVAVGALDDVGLGHSVGASYNIIDSLGEYHEQDETAHSCSTSTATLNNDNVSRVSSFSFKLPGKQLNSQQGSMNTPPTPELVQDNKLYQDVVVQSSQSCAAQKNICEISTLELQPQLEKQAMDIVVDNQPQRWSTGNTLLSEYKTQKPVSLLIEQSGDVILNKNRVPSANKGTVQDQKQFNTMDTLYNVTAGPASQVTNDNKQLMTSSSSYSTNGEISVSKHLMWSAGDADYLAIGNQRASHDKTSDSHHNQRAASNHYAVQTYTDMKITREQGREVQFYHSDSTSSAQNSSTLNSSVRDSMGNVRTVASKELMEEGIYASNPPNPNKRQANHKSNRSSSVSKALLHSFPKLRRKSTGLSYAPQASTELQTSRNLSGQHTKYASFQDIGSGASAGQIAAGPSASVGTQFRRQRRSLDSSQSDKRPVLLYQPTAVVFKPVDSENADQVQNTSGQTFGHQVTVQPPKNNQSTKKGILNVVVKKAAKFRKRLQSQKGTDQ